MRKKAFTVTAFLAASYIIASSVFNRVTLLTDNSNTTRQMFQIFFGLSILLMILAKVKNELSSAYKMATGICLFLSIPMLYNSINNIIAVYNSIYSIKKAYVGILTGIILQFSLLLLSLLIAAFCAFSLYKIKKYNKILSITAGLIGLVLLISLYRYFYLLDQPLKFSYIINAFLTVTSQTIMLLYGFGKEDNEGIKINRQVGFILAVIIIALICIEGDYAKTTYVYIAFPIFVYCLVNVVTDLLIGKNYKNENNSIVYTINIRTFICALSLIINSIIIAFIDTRLPRDMGGLAILPIITVCFISNIAFTCAMRLCSLRVVILAVLSIILPYIAIGIAGILL